MQDGVGRPRQGYEYSRTMNPTRKALQECLAALEGGDRLLQVRVHATQLLRRPVHHESRGNEGAKLSGRQGF